MNYYKFDIKLSNIEEAEILMAFLSEFPFDTFKENEGGFEAYIPEDLFEESLEEVVDEMRKKILFTYTIDFIPTQNWNALWESNFMPITIPSANNPEENFASVRAEFHGKIQAKHELLIAPKMAFGTGHHETTYMMLQQMESLVLENKRVFDFGCGTGILSILASKMKADPVFALDIDKNSTDNTIENMSLNDVNNIHRRDAGKNN